MYLTILVIYSFLHGDASACDNRDSLPHTAYSAPRANPSLAIIPGGGYCLTASRDAESPVHVAAKPLLHTRHATSKTKRQQFHLVSAPMTSKTPQPLTSPFTTQQAQNAQRAWALFIEKPIEIKSSVKMQLVLIPPGTFVMGSAPDAVGPQDDQKPAQVTLTKPFYIGKFEVMQGEFQAVMGKNDSFFSQLPIKNVDRLPVESVSWHDAVAFCKELTERDRRAGVIPEDWEYSLPTEAQWEYACRAGTTTETHFGNSLSSKEANFNGTLPLNGAAKGPYLDRTEIVGNYPANAFGLHDMHGNVCEWCLDVYVRRLPGGVDPLVFENDESNERAHVIKGGHWFLGGRECVAAFRPSCPPERLGMIIGFRVVLQQKTAR